MEFSEVLRRRKMVRRYRETPVDPAAIERLLWAGRRAPSAGNSRGQHLISVTDHDLIEEIAALAGEASYVAKGFDPWLSSAPVHIVVAVDREAYESRYAEADKRVDVEREWSIPYWWVDGGAALMAILLAAVDEGLAAGFLGGHRLLGLADLLGIPDSVEVIGLITVGHPAPDRRSRSLDRPPPSDDRIHRDRW